MRKHLIAVGLMAVLSGWGLQQASASVTAANLGTANPPTTLGAYTVAPYDPGSIAGSTGTAHETGGNGDPVGTDGSTASWATWGQSYTGNVYLGGGGTTLTIDLSNDTEAVYFYEEPNQFSNFNMTATDSSGAFVTTVINGDYGSSGVGFSEDTPGGPYLSTITVTATDSSGYAVGEFGISTGGVLTGSTGGPSVPEPASLSLLALGATAMLGRRRRNA